MLAIIKLSNSGLNYHVRELCSRGKVIGASVVDATVGGDDASVVVCSFVGTSVASVVVGVVGAAVVLPSVLGALVVVASAVGIPEVGASVVVGASVEVGASVVVGVSPAVIRLKLQYLSVSQIESCACA